MMLMEFSLDEQEKYGILDEDDFLIGVKDDAPVEFKAAYEHDKKQADEQWAAGID